MEPGAAPTRATTPSDPDLWFAIGIVGVVLFLVGVYQPALAHVPYPGAVQTVVAAAGAATAVLGFTFSYRARAARPRPAPTRAADQVLRLGPSVEVYDPRRAVDRSLPPEDTSGEPMESGPP
ncbi:MAG: hypothetical protein L3K14_03440 [Thermoplasmata archaeon]|nr:hypothetical protein [Thermoplasmata archaeon]